MEYSTEKEFLQPILDHGMEGMSEVLQNLFNLAMKLERENALKASPYQRTEGRPAMPTASRNAIFKHERANLNCRYRRPVMWTFTPAALNVDYAVKEQSMRQWLRCIFKESPRDRYGISLKNFADLRSAQCR